MSFEEILDAESFNSIPWRQLPNNTQLVFSNSDKTPADPWALTVRMFRDDNVLSRKFKLTPLHDPQVYFPQVFGQDDKSLVSSIIESAKNWTEQHVRPLFDYSTKETGDESQILDGQNENPDHPEHISGVLRDPRIDLLEGHSSSTQNGNYSDFEFPKNETYGGTEDSSIAPMPGTKFYPAGKACHFNRDCPQHSYCTSYLGDKFYGTRCFVLLTPNSREQTSKNPELKAS